MNRMAVTHQILVGDCLELLRQMPHQSVQCCVTSPPYYGFRDYGVDDKIGLEETPAEQAQGMEHHRKGHRAQRLDLAVHACPLSIREKTSVFTCMVVVY